MHYNGDHKRDKSSDIFNENRISTCSFVRRNKSSYEAVPFYTRPVSASNLSTTSESFYKTSTNAEAYRSRALNHAGMGSRKPLEPYNPNAQRSRLPIPTLKQYYVNRSIIEIGDRTKIDKKHYITTNSNHLSRNPHKFFKSLHPGIINYQIKWDNCQKIK